MEFLLLDERAKLKLAIIRRLEQKYSFSERKEILCDQLAVSHYLLERNMVELNDDAARFGLNGEMEIIEQNNEVILFQSEQISSSIIEEYYVRNSLEFSLLKTIFFQKFTSIKKYSEKQGMSRTVVYKIIDHIRQELKQYGIKLTKNCQLIGNEKTIRQYFTMLFYRIYKDTDTIYNQTDILLVNNLFASLKQCYENVHTFHFLRHYLFVFLERTRKGRNYALSKKTLVPALDKSNELYQLLYHWCSNVLKGPTKEINVEVQGILNILSVYRTELCDYENSQLEHYAAQLNDYFFQQMQLTLKEGSIQQKILAILYQHKYVTPFIDISLRVMDLEFFYERYPVIFEICQQFVTDFKEDFPFSKKTLFLNLLLTLAQMYDQMIEKRMINVYVDFTQGENYNQFIKAQIQTFDTFSLNFQSVIRPDTDLIISDTRPNTVFSAKVLIWLAPPRASDWQHFGDEIVRINKMIQRNKHRS
ncbi:helix-turn-helix domain-containing protein [Enterococcus faecalis]